MHEDEIWFHSINELLATMAGWLGLFAALALGLWRWIIRGGRFIALLCRGVVLLGCFADRRSGRGNSALVDDIEELKAAQLESRLRLANIEEQLGVGTFAANADQRIDWLSPHAIRLFGKDSSELLGTKWLAAVDDASRDDVESVWNLVSRQRAPTSSSVVTMEGKRLEIDLWPSVDESGNVIAVYGRLVEKR